MSRVKKKRNTWRGVAGLMAASTSIIFAAPSSFAAAGDDPRATLHHGSVVACNDAGNNSAGLPGFTYGFGPGDIDPAQIFTYTVDAPDPHTQHLSITSVVPGTTVYGIVIQGAG
ncbi:MAG TPA: hypothetical protein VE081_14395, partial [Sporichthyaceae bacterium]|nr:hypothetical protein [Sporichthyaceae bacterium]